jgi:CubicO group peptidase (beta-lactamase class C family)
MRKPAAAALLLLAAVVCSERASGQSLTFSLFERYLEALREQAGIPGMSGAVLQDGVIAWERGFGRQDLEAAIPASPSTPYLVGDLSQAVGATILLRKCVDQSYAEVTDRVVRWVPGYPEPQTTLKDLLTHTAPDGAYRHDPVRFSALTPVVEECADVSYTLLAAVEVFDRLGMADSVPGQDLAAPSEADREALGPARLDQYAAVLRRLAVPYHLDSRSRPVRTDLTPRGADIATGLVSTARDLARFDAALDRDVLLQPDTRRASWTQATSLGAPLPTGLGWFVQNYNGELVVWQFGMIKGAYSSLIVKVPNRALTFVLLANSDGLSAPYALDKGDVTASLFAKLFLRLLVS